VKGSAEVNVVSLENAYGSAAVVLAYTLRVGPYVSARFNVAKVLQIPAKLGGHNLFEIVAVSARCNKDCDEAADAAVNLLQEAIATNAR
jgi:hypothetical protein